MRGKKAKNRPVRADSRYGSPMVAKFINFVMLDGKKSIAEKNVYGALDDAAQKLNIKPIEVLENAVENVKPKLEVRSRRVGGANYQVPTPVPEGRQLALAFRWIIAAAKNGRGSSKFAESLSRELIAATKKEGSAYKKMEEVHKMAEANRAFAHFQW